MAAYSFGVSQRIPAIAPNESCRLTLAAAKGFCSRIKKSAKESDVGASLSRSKSGASSTNMSITQARITDGDAPTMSA